MQLFPGIPHGELPLDAVGARIALGNVGGHLGLEGRFVGDTPVQARLGEHGEFHFSHIEPASMLGRVVDFQAFGDGPGLFGWKGFILKT